eukprot:3455690-Pyramimonas_sp.AAC.1
MCSRAPCNNQKLSWRRTQPYAIGGTAIVNIFFGELPMGLRNAALGGGEMYADGPTGAVGGVPYGATKRFTV